MIDNANINTRKYLILQGLRFYSGLLGRGLYRRPHFPPDLERQYRLIEASSGRGARETGLV
jgi:hypothetical protein